MLLIKRNCLCNKIHLKKGEYVQKNDIIFIEDKISELISIGCLEEIPDTQIEKPKKKKRSNKEVE